MAVRRGLAQWIVVAILLNAGLGLCTCDLDRAVAGGSAIVLSGSGGDSPSEGTTCSCAHPGDCLCCAPMLIAKSPVIGPCPAVSDAPVSVVTAPSSPELTDIEHPPRV